MKFHSIEKERGIIKSNKNVIVMKFLTKGKNKFPKMSNEAKMENFS